MKITVREVAEAADVSLGTVSRVLRGHTSVKPEIAKRVHKAIADLNYRPLRNRLVRSGDGNPLRGRNIAVVMLAMDRSLETLPAVATVVHGAEAAVSRAGGTLLFIDCPDVTAIPPALASNQVHGLLLKGALQGNWVDRVRPELIERLRSLPAVWATGRPENAWGDSVCSNDCLVGSIVARQMAARGHKHVASLNPKSDHLLFCRREASFRWNAEQLGMTYRRYAGKIEPTEWTFPLRPVRDVACIDGLVADLLASKPRPTAVFTPADSIARLVYRALNARGLAIGRDLSVVSCNNESSLNSGLFPSLATVDIHGTLIGQRSVEQLAWRMANPTVRQCFEIAIEPDWVEGESLGEPRTGRKEV